MALLAQGDPALLEAAWAALSPRPQVRWLRPAETGMVMVRGRAGGTGQPFNLGEMTVTRATALLETDPPRTGFAYVAGPDRRHAELAAMLDAVLQIPAWRDVLESALLRPLAQAAAQARARRADAVGATRVNFATLVRGDG
jgi:alpha-D-ribose 1-methylphosphonate 5-triphosphate synthase subunit PhnG